MTIEYKDSKRIVGLSTDKLPSSTYETDFSSTTGWSVESGGITYVDSIHYNHPSGVAMNTGVLYDLTTSNVSETSWTLDYDLNITTSTGGSGSSCQLFIGLSNNSTVSSSAIDTAQDYLGHFMIEAAGTHAIRKGNGSDSPEDPVGTVFSRALEADVLYCRLQRISAIKGTLSFYSDQGRTSLIESKDITITTALAGLRYLKVILACKTTSGSHVMVGDITNMKFWNTITSGIESKPTNVQDNSLLVQKDTAKRYWFSEALAPTYEDDFTSDNSVDQDASKISVNTAQERWDFNIVNDQTNDSSSIDITTALSDTNWVMDFDYTWTSLSGTTNVNTSFFGISNSNGTVPSQTAQDHIGVRLQTGSGFSIAGCHSNNGTMQSGLSSTFTTIPSVTTLYFRIVRTSTTSMTVKIYTTSARTTVSEEKTVAVSASTTGLRYVKISPYEGTNGGSNTEVGYVKNLKIYNAVSTPTPATWTKEISSVPTVSGLQLHLDANDASTITKDGSNLVSAWNDKSGQANHVTQATGSKQPLWVDRVQDTLPTIRFDGSSDEMAVTYGSSLSTAATVFVVCTMPTGNGSERFVLDGLTSGGRFAFLVTSSTPYIHYMYRGNGITSTNVDKTMRMFTLVFNSSSSSLGIDKTDVATGNAGTQSPTGLTLGAGYYGGASFGDTDICEILIYGSALSTTDRTSIEDYLSNKWSTP